MERSPRAIRIRTEPAPAKGFFRLPWEIRKRIYELSLVELPKWEKIHQPDCDLIAHDLHTCERPPFIDKSIIYTPLSGCRCAKRHSLNVLLANRQVHREAAPVFWSRNTFCFTRASDLTEEIGTKLRPAHRLLLRHIVLMIYGCDSLPNKFPSNFQKPTVDNMWDTILQCSGLKTLELSYNAFTERFDDIGRIRKQLPDLELLNMIVLMAYRVWPRRDQSEPERRPPWTMNNGEATNGPPRPPGHNNNSNNNTQSQASSQQAAFIPFADAIPAPPPPPPSEHYFVLNPYLAGYDYCAHRDLSRTLWFKAGIPLDIDAATESLEAYTNIQRNFRTNFLVHLRHEITKLPEAWARDYQMGAASLRTPWTRPPAPLPRRHVTQVMSSDSSSGSGDASWDPNYGASRHNPQAIRQVCGRLPEHMRDGPYTDNNVVLRDGRCVPLQIMGLPISKQMRTRRYQQRMRIAREKHAAGELTAREEVEARQAQDRRETHQLQRLQSETVDMSLVLLNRRLRNTNRETERRTEEREARAAQRAQLDERREAQEAVRQAARHRLSTENATAPEENVDKGSEADTEEDAPPKTKTTKPKVRGTTPSPPKKTKKPSMGRAAFRERGSSSRQHGRMELYYSMRDGEYDDEDDFDEEVDYDEVYDDWDGGLVA
ncbi:hypothetical protein SEUCBS140593_002132 [Sporothrix eucalyptigena]|uniref:DUF7730 domain-containing protein n=1 Tax=Sporothrix eucalyptigena TaxID=1812306 RepID=A0ABP0B4U9_9PEZI